MNSYDELRALTCHCGRISCRHHEGDSMNTTTRKLIQLGIDNAERRLKLAEDRIERTRYGLRQDEATRDSLVNEIGALKESLAETPRKIARVTVDPERIAEEVAFRLKRHRGSGTFIP